MPYEELKAIAASYTPASPGELLEMALERRRRQESDVLELAALASELSVDSIVDLGLEPDLHPHILRAFQLQYPNVHMESLQGRSVDALQGFVNGVKGKYFEVLVEERLNSGEALGELKLLPGQIASIAGSPTQAGWDLQISDRDGELLERIQLKATEDMGYIKDALERYPDIRIAAPAEIDGMADEILQTDITHESVRSMTQGQVEELGESALANFLDQSAELALDMVPILPAIMITVTEGRAVISGSATLQMSLKRGAKRLGRATAYNALGMGLSALIGPAAMPTVMGVRITEQRFGHQMAMGELLRSKTEEVVALTGQNSPDDGLRLNMGDC